VHLLVSVLRIFQNAQCNDEKTHRISITKPNRLNIFILGIMRNTNSACEQHISLVLQEMAYTEDIALLWVMMATLSGNVPSNKQ